jgi:uncharacterized membrane protein (UPF0127 family)
VTAGSSPRATILLPGGGSISAEIADDPEERRLGLMYRASLGRDDGMLLVFPEPGPQGIWMKNCLVPLDLLWLDGEGEVLDLQESAPPCPEEPCPLYQPEVRATYVLEIAAGRAGRAGLRPGSRVRIITLEPLRPR